MAPEVQPVDGQHDLAALKEALAPTIPLNPATGEPRRPWVVWAASGLVYAGLAGLTAGLLWIYWRSVHFFEDAARLHGFWPTEPGSWWRVLMVTGLTLGAVLIGWVAGVTAYYSFHGYRWTRWSGLVALALAGAAWLGNDITLWSMVPVAVGVLLLWLPPVTRFFGHWQAVRHPAPAVPQIRDEVFYGPLPRYEATS